MKSSDLFAVNGAVAVVTGGAGGIGYAIAEVMAQNGAVVVVADIRKSAAEEAAAKLRIAGAAVEAMELDVADAAAVHRFFDALSVKYGHIDIVFANAGVSAGPGFASPAGSIENVAPEKWQSSIGVNLDGAFWTIQAAARFMKVQGSGSIIVTGSIAAFMTSRLPGYAYHAAKAGITQITRLAARELGPFNVRVNAIAPGSFVTDIGDGRMRDHHVAAQLSKSIPLGRLADPSEIKGLALYLASDASRFMTGAVLTIDGGASA
jgi:NAD(P)-dependent dehydrogenase (short-subunit alcohol dehydrogenase family)